MERTGRQTHVPKPPRSWQSGGELQKGPRPRLDGPSISERTPPFPGNQPPEFPGNRRSRAIRVVWHRSPASSRKEDSSKSSNFFFLSFFNQRAF